MPSQKTKFIVGLFLASGITIVVVAIILLGTTRYFEKGRFYVTYFNESVQGLDKDSPVKYRGVTVGRVDRIAVAPDSRLIEVLLKIESDLTLGPDMVAQLNLVGITGSMFVELDRKKEGEPDRSPTLTFPSKYPVVASSPSDIGQLLQSVNTILERLRGVDLEGIANRIKSNLDRIETAISDANVKALSRGIESSVAAFNRLLDNQKWDSILGSAEKSAMTLNALLVKSNDTLAKADSLFSHLEGITLESKDQIRAALDDFKRAMENANLLLEKGILLANSTDSTLSSLREHLLITAQNLEKASENLTLISEILADQPSQLLFGEPPPRRPVEPEVHRRE